MSADLDMVLVGGEWRAVGCVSAAELEEMERAYDAGDARMEARLKLLREGRAERVAMFFDGKVPPPAGSWSNDFRGGTAEAACASTVLRLLGRT